MFKIVICEDNCVCRDILKEYVYKILEEITNQFEIIMFNSGEELIEKYPDNVDIFFLDIQMKKLTGLDAARQIRDRDDKSHILFTTGLVDYIHDGYEVRAYRYLLKPIQFEELKKHVKSCLNDIIRNRENYLIIQNKSETHKINIDDITFVEVINKDIMVHTKKQIYDTKTSMKTIEKELILYGFYRCHKSFLVNMKHIEHIKQNIVLINNNEIPISRYRIKSFKKILLETLGDIIC
ncbi:response regulator [[Clostridium] bifermentans ATCC 19299]|uniref:LytR/AlgR family response regulator transcription factor n=1 Tax=Paraclostridium bifermentans TaxID=1490 RepID=UPI00038D8AF0|nr:LytTR family DNA-binding domain-containing protein [Paraclostridium bifermentans]EQK48683.1 response regulator [[Clostridium] bifermentans ATCC 19299] [Paraclostridium bifermentans ATCC 19299]MCR1876778.1 LytTR family DNA-binding domain-containing protein [Paraclostridium bifermentans]